MTPTKIVAAFPLALLVAVVSLGGILLPSTYARETANWAAQGVGQDWVDLILAVPWLAIAGVAAMRGSRRALILLAGAYAYAAYELVIYAFAIHFNALFLVYCAALGLSVFALVGVSASLVRAEADTWFGDGVPVRSAGWFLIVVGVLFTLLWLGDVVPALVRGELPRSVVEAGLVVNPVHVIDFSIVLPVHVACGIALLRRRPLGYTFAPVVLAFGVLMALSIAGMMLVMRIRGADVELPVAGGMTVVAIAAAMLLVRFLAAMRRHGLALRMLRKEGEGGAP